MIQARLIEQVKTFGGSMLVQSRIVWGGLLMVLLQACSQQNSDETTSGIADTDTSQWPRIESAIKRDEVLERRVTALLSQLSLAEKIGQMIQPEIKFITPQQVQQFHIGSVLNGGGTAPNNDKFAPVSQWVALADEYYLASKAGNRAAIPLIWGSDAVHGHNNVVGATLFPHNIGLGAARDESLIRRIGQATASEVAVTGIDWTFAPTVAVVRDDRWGRTFESYSEDPALVKRYARVMVEGLQGVNGEQLDERHVVATAKHFVGDGGTQRGIDRGDTQVSERELLDIHAAGFIAALEAGVQTVMASFNSWNGVKMHGNYYLLTEVLKEQMGFDGFVVGDWNGHRQIPGCTVTACAQAINAGLDMFMVPSDWQALYENTLRQAESGEITQARIDDAVSRILRVKLRAGLMDKGLVSERAMSAKADVLGARAHRELAREAVRKSLVLLKNNGSLLPLNPTHHIAVVGSGANDIGRQSGGWTLSWQGTGNSVEDFPGATSIYHGIEQWVVGHGGTVSLSVDGDVSDSADVAVVVIGEEPYAEWHGDIASIEYQYGIKQDLKILRDLKAKAIPVVVVFLSGRPLWVNKELNAADAFVAAWLPGSEGAGVADVLLADEHGEVRHDFIGRLSFSWPQYIHQTVLNIGDDDYRPLFEYGYGLSYAEPRELLGQLTEENTLPDDGTIDEVWMFVSRTLSPWSMWVVSGAQPPVPVEGNVHTSGIDANVTITSVDKASQEDARRIQWRGLEHGGVYLEATTPQDLSIVTSEGGFIQWDMQINQAPTDSLQLAVRCGVDCGAELVLDSLIPNIGIQQWQTIRIDLQCLTRAGMDFSRVTQPFLLQTSGQLTLSMANLKIVPQMQASSIAPDIEPVVLSCAL